MIKSENLLLKLPIKPCCICEEEFINADGTLECIKIFHKWSKCWGKEKSLIQLTCTLGDLILNRSSN